MFMYKACVLAWVCGWIVAMLLGEGEVWPCTAAQPVVRAAATHHHDEQQQRDGFYLRYSVQERHPSCAPQNPKESKKCAFKADFTPVLRGDVLRPALSTLRSYEHTGMQQQQAAGWNADLLRNVERMTRKIALASVGKELHGSAVRDSARADTSHPVPAAAMHGDGAREATLQHWIVAIKAPIVPKVLERVRAALGPFTTLSYVSHSSFRVVAPAKVVARLLLSEAAVVSAVRPLDARLLKLAPSLRLQAHQRKYGDVHERAIHVRVVDGVVSTRAEAQTLAAKWQAALNALLSEGRRVNVTVLALLRFCISLADHSRAAYPSLAALEKKDKHLLLDWLADMPEVIHVEPLARMKLANKHARFVIQSDVIDSMPLWTGNITGEGEVIAITDSGIDYDSCFFHDVDRPVPVNTHDPLHRKIVSYRTFSEGFIDKSLRGGDRMTHGTHVAGSVAGSIDLCMQESYNITKTTVQKLAEFNGMAPDAKIAMYDCASGTDNFVLPANVVRDNFEHAYTVARARIQSGSYGDQLGFYDSPAHDVDTFAYSHPDFLFVFAADNYGAHGSVSVGSPGVAKNVITVGSTRNHPLSFFEEGRGHSSGVRVYMSGDDKLGVVFSVKPADFVDAPQFNGMTKRERLSLLTLSLDGSCNVAQSVPNRGEGVVLIARRDKTGRCDDRTIVQSAQNVAPSTALLIVIDSNPGPPGDFQFLNVHMPLYLVTVMISNHDGNLLWSVLEDGSATVRSDGMATLDVDFPVDYVSIENSEERVSDYSGRGPTHDGRIKPDIVAPGQWIVSARSDGTLHTGAGTQCASLAGATLPKEGTSMSTPIAAGAAALVRQFFASGAHINARCIMIENDGRKLLLPQRVSVRPSASLVKAVLIHSARGVADGNVTTTKCKNHPDPIYPARCSGPASRFTTSVASPPSFIQGFGRIQLDRVLKPTVIDSFLPFLFVADAAYHDAWVHDGMEVDGQAVPDMCPSGDGDAYSRVEIPQYQALNTGQRYSICVAVPGERVVGSSLLRATLVWTDPPSDILAHVALVNDLDLVVLLHAEDETIRAHWAGNTDLNRVVTPRVPSEDAGAYPEDLDLDHHYGSNSRQWDAVNNVEVVHIVSEDIDADASSGVNGDGALLFSVHVLGAHVPLGPQNFSLVVSSGDSSVGGVRLVPMQRCHAVDGDTSGIFCPHNCSGHGSCDIVSGHCVCDALWAGMDCATASVALVAAPAPALASVESIDFLQWKFYHVEVSESLLSGRAMDDSLKLIVNATSSSNDPDFYIVSPHESESFGFPTLTRYSGALLHGSDGSGGGFVTRTLGNYDIDVQSAQRVPVVKIGVFGYGTGKSSFRLDAEVIMTSSTSSGSSTGGDGIDASSSSTGGSGDAGGADSTSSSGNMGGGSDDWHSSDAYGPNFIDLLRIFVGATAVLCAIYIVWKINKRFCLNRSTEGHRDRKGFDPVGVVGDIGDVDMNITGMHDMDSEALDISTVSDFDDAALDNGDDSTTYTFAQRTYPVVFGPVWTDQDAHTGRISPSPDE